MSARGNIKSSLLLKIQAINFPFLIFLWLLSAIDNDKFDFENVFKNFFQPPEERCCFLPKIWQREENSNETPSSDIFFIYNARDSINSLSISRKKKPCSICTTPSRDHKSLKNVMHHLRPKVIINILVLRWWSLVFRRNYSTGTSRGGEFNNVIKSIKTWLLILCWFA